MRDRAHLPPTKAHMDWEGLPVGLAFSAIQHYGPAALRLAMAICDDSDDEAEAWRRARAVGLLVQVNAQNIWADRLEAKMEADE